MGTKRNITICFGILLVLASMFLPAASAWSKYVVGENLENVLIVVDTKKNKYSVTPLDSNEIDLNVYVNDELKKSDVEYSSVEILDDELILIYDESIVLEGIELEPGDTVEFTVTIDGKEVKDKESKETPGQIKKA
ncbi:hypothetical protein ACSAZK_12755 [Methanosarcina sp. Mfa9]|uniref:hypothetical protein n=1 Tax=Methanosarcina sp. Mfa9 TaxID=3439063 RepID=UPI003F852199